MPNWPPYCFIDGDRTVGIPAAFLPTSDLVKKDRASIQGPALPDWKLEAVLPSLRDRAVEFIARWPGVVKPESVCDQLVHQADLMATCAEILGAMLPDDVGEDSFSLVPLLKGSTTPVREHAVSCSIRGVPGVRLGSWKYIAAPDSGGWTGGGERPGAERAALRPRLRPRRAGKPRR